MGEHFFGVAAGFGGHFGKGLFNSFFAGASGFFRGVVKQVFLEGGDGVGVAFLFDEARFGKIHEVGTGATKAVAGGAEGGDEAHRGQFGNDFIEFKARFGGKPREILVPVGRVIAIYARENGQGMAFPPPVDLLSNSGDSVAAGPLATPEPALAASLAPVSASEDRVVQLVLTDEARKEDGADGDGPRPHPPAAGGTRPSLKRVK